MMLKVIFAGTPDFSVPCLQALLDAHYDVVAVLTQPDKPSGRGQKLTASPVKQLAVTAGLPVIQVKTLREAAIQQQLAALQADVIIVVAYGLLLPIEVLQIPRLGCINVHASLLPRWRGAAPIQRAIAAGDKETGVTIMQMDVGLDTGAMLRHAAYAIKATDTAQHVHDHLAALGARELMHCLQDLQQGKIKPQAQDDALANYAAKITKEEALINWQQSADEIANKIRAFNPWPVSFTHIDQQLLRIWSAHAVDQTTTQTPGCILHCDKQGIDVATSKGLLRITQCQLAGGKILTVQQLLNSRKDLFAPGKVVR